MGFLKDQGETFSFEESKKYQNYIKQEGITQFLQIYKKFHDYSIDKCQVLWGDEIEYHILQLDHINKKVRLNIQACEEVFTQFKKIESTQVFSIQPEYGAWMIETVPMKVFTSYCQFSPALQNNTARREVISSLLPKDSIILSCPVFPMMGVGDFFVPSSHDVESLKLNVGDIPPKDNPFSDSIFSNDLIINPHPRFGTLTKNIRTRRGEKVCIKIPIYKDKNTSYEPTADEPYPGYVYMDSMVFGMGCCCLQVTMSTLHVSHARFVYDQLAIISPLFLALTAGSPIFKGKLTDNDARWPVIEQSVDDRSEEERDPNSKRFIPKSRYSSISRFMGNCIYYKKEYNDFPFPVNEEMMNYLTEKSKELGIEMDEQMKAHIGFLYMRDALVIFKDKVENLPPNSTAHFENIQSTNWNSVRFKPQPSLDANMSWRVEFRPMEVQLTDEENSLLAFLILKMSRFFFHENFGLNFYIPISYVEKNWERAVKRNAALDQKFYFRKNVFDKENPEIIEITLKEFFFGSPDFIGINQIIENFGKLPDLCKSNDFYCKKEYQKVMKFIDERVSGRKLSLASWIRNFVVSHPKYNHDSIVTEEINYDLIIILHKIFNKEIVEPNFTIE